MAAFTYTFDGQPILYWHKHETVNSGTTEGVEKFQKVIQPSNAVILKLPFFKEPSYFDTSYQYFTVHTFSTGDYLRFKTRKVLSGGYYYYSHILEMVYIDGTATKQIGNPYEYREDVFNWLFTLPFQPSLMIAPYYCDYTAGPEDQPIAVEYTSIGWIIDLNYKLQYNSVGSSYYAYNFPELDNMYCTWPDMTNYIGATYQPDNRGEYFNYVDDIRNPLFSWVGQTSTPNDFFRIFYWNTGISSTDYRIGDLVTQYNKFVVNTVKPGSAFIDPTDPLDPGGNSESDVPIGGGGTFDYSSDVISPPLPPTYTATQSGFVYIYNPTQAQLKDIADYCWTDSTALQAVKAIYGDASDGILSLHVVPCAVPNAEIADFAIAGVVNTGIKVNIPTGQYSTVDCGSIQIKEFTGSFLDYAPYTKIQIYLPYIGYRDLNTDEVMGKTVNVKYVIDILTGEFVCTIQADATIINQFNGTAIMSIPITGADHSRYINNAISTATTIAAGYATGGISAVGGLASGSIARTMASLKPNITKSGNFSGGSGLLCYQKPYVVISAPKQNKPKNQKEMFGYPCNMDKKLGDLTGYTEVSKINLKSLNATDAEKDEIARLLEGGVYL